ncbi:glycosyltransferase [Flavobacterium difficile]|uniref:Glycosyltransferase family 4 protein n=1 Tax=Flavobacterium difficile TaxID=2709659 RepID=A0ABX0I1R6_9FLAO|nr:glycosyltransferase [Flavobacterium difficile]NHM01125.1 glycosyltransferase family 4 protein [Flavobacterium difficile]
MKILMVAIPNHHFFQWVNQLEHAGYEVHWFDITDGAGFSDKIKWVKQSNGWKLKWNFPFRSRLKHYFPTFYKFVQNYNERKVTAVFEKMLHEIQPDIVHSFEMQLAVWPILSVMEKNTIPWIYSSWGSDVFNYSYLGMKIEEVRNCLKRVNYLITDCQRDFSILNELGYAHTYLGVYPGNGGVTIDSNYNLEIEKRNKIIIKGYDDGVGKALEVCKALTQLPIAQLQKFDLVIFSADKNVEDFVNSSDYFQKLEVRILARTSYFPNDKLLQIMGESSIYIGNSISDGMPNSLIEAMGMGAFPIQSNPGNVTAEIIKDGINGFLIQNPLNLTEISTLISKAIHDEQLRKEARTINVNFVKNNCDRHILKDKIVSLYKNIK